MTWRDAIGWRARADHELTSAEAVRELRRKLGPPAPRLRVKRGQITGDWIWRVLGADNEWLTFGRATTHAEALAVGLAALEAASVERISP